MQLPRFNVVAADVDTALAGKRKRRVVEKKGAIMTAHGIWTEGEWQEELSLRIQKAGFLAGRVDYGNHLFTTPFWFRLNDAVQRAEAKYNQLTEDYKGQVSVIAHSYGSLTIANLLSRKPAIKFKTIILYASVVHHSFPWTTVHRNGQFVEFLHEFGGADMWPKLAPYAFRFLRNAGNSGAYGFDVNEIEHFHQFRYPDTTHSDLQTPNQFLDVWIPFIEHGCGALNITSDYAFAGRAPD